MSRSFKRHPSLVEGSKKFLKEQASRKVRRVNLRKAFGDPDASICNSVYKKLYSNSYIEITPYDIMSYEVDYINKNKVLNKDERRRLKKLYLNK